MKLWEISGLDFEGQPVISEENGIDVATCLAGGSNEPTIEEAKQNALLISVAPEMYDTLQDVLYVIDKRKKIIIAKIQAILDEVKGEWP